MTPPALTCLARNAGRMRKGKGHAMQMATDSAQRISLELLGVDERVFPRHKLDKERVAVMAERYREGGVEALPPIEVVHDRDLGKYLVADGHHRVFAAHQAGLEHLMVVFPQIQAGLSTVDAAHEVGLRAAGRSGKPLSRSEQREAILRLLDRDPGRSDAEIAALVGATRQTVWRARRIATSGEEAGQGERWASASVSADDVARQLVRGIDRLWQARGLSDVLLGDRTGRRLAGALQEHFGDDALAWAERFAAWAARAVDELREAE